MKMMQHHAVSCNINIFNAGFRAMAMKIGYIESIGSVTVDQDFSILKGLVPRFLIECMRYNIHQYTYINIHHL